MIIGSFENGSPFVEGLLVLPRLRIVGPISFLVDTGADLTMLVPSDVNRLRIPYSRLRDRAPIFGFKGSAETFRETALLVFAEEKGITRVYRRRIRIMEDDPDTDMSTDSLLGQDVLSSWRMVHDPSKRRVTFTVRTADATYRPTTA